MTVAATPERGPDGSEHRVAIALASQAGYGLRQEIVLGIGGVHPGSSLLAALGLETRSGVYDRIIGAASAR